MDFYSAHADRGEMVRYLSCQDPAQVERLFLVHGSEQARKEFKSELEKGRFTHVDLPGQGARFTL
jgi:metallo-beta-lactamase family protein